MRWLKSLFARERREREFDCELQFHLDAATRQKIAHGILPEEARRQAMLELGGKEQTARQLRDVHGIAFAERARADLKAGLRLMRRAPGFSAAVILTLALGIGAMRSQITARFLAQGLRVALIGCACGLLLALASSRLLAGMLFGVSTFDAVTLIGVILLILLVAGFAALVPALRASRTDPMRVLREQ